MTEQNEKINQLLDKLEILLKRQEDFSKEINNLKSEIYLLQNPEKKVNTSIEAIKSEQTSITSNFDAKKKIEAKIQATQSKKTFNLLEKLPLDKAELEKFIGENLINKIGILITVFGVAIGAKYSIENNLISPLTRIIIGYLFGLVLLGFGIKLKAKYDNYSAVLVSGAMAILYFITYAAYGFYHLIPQMMAFALMLIFTVFTVVAAINYNKQIIAHIGLVGAYAVPFLLSEGSEKIAVLFGYMSIINIGILILALKKYWKPLYYVSFGLTWLIFLSWYLRNYESDKHFALALVYSSFFFVLFYITFLGYKLIQKEKFVIDDIILILLNSFIFYGLGYAILDKDPTGRQLLGLFTLLNAIVHFAASTVVYRQKLADKNILYLIAGLVLMFITIAIPVQLDGNWVTLMWVGEAAILFWIGRTKKVNFYEILSYFLMVLAFYSLLHDWTYVYDGYDPSKPYTRIATILNINFLSSILFIAAFVFINDLNLKNNDTSHLEPQNGIWKIMHFAFPLILLISTYFAFRMEISNYWEQYYADSAIKINIANQEYPKIFWNEDLSWFKTVWILNYSLLFLSSLSFVNLKKIKNRQLGMITLGVLTFAIFVFLIQGLYTLSELRENYIQQTLSQYYKRETINLWLRYLSFPFGALALFAIYKYITSEISPSKFKLEFELLLHITILWIASSELINWMDIFKSEQSYKLGLSILWGAYSLFLIVIGIWKKNKPMRIGAIALFGITLIKLFFYDISHLNTIAKTIVFVSLGILLLIISFLYNKYKHLISDDEVLNQTT